jgi:hypothetical protein
MWIQKVLAKVQSIDTVACNNLLWIFLSFGISSVGYSALSYAFHTPLQIVCVKIFLFFSISSLNQNTESVHAGCL